jgi:hypothetical protein
MDGSQERRFAGHHLSSRRERPCHVLSNLPLLSTPISQTAVPVRVIEPDAWQCCLVSGILTHLRTYIYALPELWEFMTCRKLIE